MTRQSPILWIGVIFVIVVVFSGAAFLDFLGKAWPTAKDTYPSGDGVLPTGPSGTGYSGLGLTIYYVDGTKRDFKPTSLTVVPLEIFDGGGAVSKVEVKVYVKPVTTEPATQWTVNGKLTVCYEQGSEWALQTLEDWTEIRRETETITASKSEAWASGVEKQVYTSSIVASHIEGIVAAFGDGDYRMSFVCDVDLAFSFQDGTTETKSAEATTTWRFEYSLIPGPGPGPEPGPEPKLSSVAVRMYAGPLH